MRHAAEMRALDNELALLDISEELEISKKQTDAAIEECKKAQKMCQIAINDRDKHYAECEKQEHIIEGLADAAKKIHKEKQVTEVGEKAYFKLWDACYDELWNYKSAGFFKRLKYLFTGKI